MSSSRPMRVLVTGGSGFIGRALIPILLRHGHSVAATTTGAPEALAVAPGLRWVRWAAHERALPDVDLCDFDAACHLAAWTGSPTAPDADEKLRTTSVGFVEALRERVGGRRLRVVYVSSGDAVGSRTHPLREDDGERMPVGAYGSAKAEGEALVAEMPGSVVVRLFHPYGFGGERFLINRLLRRVASGEPVRIEGAEGILLNPVWGDDAADGLRRAVESSIGGTLHLGGSELLSMRSLIELCGEIVGRAPVIETVDAAPSQHHAGDCRRARAELGWATTMSLRDGLTKLYGCCHADGWERLRKLGQAAA